MSVCDIKRIQQKKNEKLYLYNIGFLVPTEGENHGGQWGEKLLIFLFLFFWSESFHLKKALKMFNRPNK